VAARLLRSWVRIPPGAWIRVSCTVQVEVSANGRSLVQRNPTEFGVPECDLGASYRRPGLTEVIEPQKMSKSNTNIL
jgi:hypothetical protein